MKLKIRLVEFKNAVAMQVIEQEGLPEKVTEGKVLIENYPELEENYIYLRGGELDENDLVSTFQSPNPKAYIQQVVGWIDEFFGGEAKFPCLCRVWSDAAVLSQTQKAVILGKITAARDGQYRAIAEIDYMPDDIMQAITDYGITEWEHANRVTGHIKEGDIYTWEK